MPTLNLNPDQLDQIRPGDRLVALNGSILTMPLTVVTALAPLPSGTLAIGMTTTTGIPANLYPDTHVDIGVTIQRDEPNPRVIRTVTRHINGLHLTSDGTGGWWTADRRYEIRKGFGGLTECENSHPVRITPAHVRAAAANPDCGWARPVLTAVSAGQRGYLCEGGTEHSYEEWAVWDHTAGDYADGGNLNHADTFRTAARDLAAVLSGPLTGGHPNPGWAASVDDSAPDGGQP